MWRKKNLPSSANTEVYTYESPANDVADTQSEGQTIDTLTIAEFVLHQ